MAEIELGVLARQCLDRRIPIKRCWRREDGRTSATGHGASGLALHHR